MTGDEVRQVCEAMLPQEEIDRLCQQGGVIERQRPMRRCTGSQPREPRS